jgi:hypothetical protein
VVSALLTSLTGNDIYTLLGKSGASLGMGAMLFAIACVCGKESE